jgi:predicted AlkP superfamily phosphohydrolase/phosphomutase
MTKREFLGTAQLLKGINRKFEAMCLELMQAEDWNLFLAFNYTLHHAGHRMWSTVNITDRVSEAEKAKLEGAVRRAYIDCDNVVGNIVAAAPIDTRLLMFSLHGMAVNHSRTHIFPDMLRRISEADVPSPGMLKRARGLLPQSIRHAVKSRLPFAMRRRLTSYWRMSEYDWETTHAFSLLSDTEGWVRINLKGREARGIVEPGHEYENLCSQISDGVKSFVDADTGEPLVQDVIRPQQVFKGAMLEDLPDLIVRWAHSPAASHRAVTSPRYGTIPWPTPGRNPEGRSGNHRSQGMLIAAGPGCRSGSIEGGHIAALAPTILELLEQPIPPEMEGRPLHLFN